MQLFTRLFYEFCCSDVHAGSSQRDDGQNGVVGIFESMASKSDFYNEYQRSKKARIELLGQIGSTQSADEFLSQLSTELQVEQHQLEHDVVEYICFIIQSNFEKPPLLIQVC